MTLTQHNNTPLIGKQTRARLAKSDPMLIMYANKLGSTDLSIIDQIPVARAYHTYIPYWFAHIRPTMALVQGWL